MLTVVDNAFRINICTRPGALDTHGLTHFGPQPAGFPNRSERRPSLGNFRLVLAAILGLVLTRTTRCNTLLGSGEEPTVLHIPGITFNGGRGTRLGGVVDQLDTRIGTFGTEGCVKNNKSDT